MYLTVRSTSLTRDTNEITILTSVRMFMANLGGLAVAYGVPKIVSMLSPDGKTNTAQDATAWCITMTCYALAGLVLLVFCFSQSKERVVMDKKETANVKVSDLFTEFVRNRPLRVLAFFFITAFAMMAVGNSAGSYYMIYNWLTLRPTFSMTRFASIPLTTGTAVRLSTTMEAISR